MKNKKAIKRKPFDYYWKNRDLTKLHPSKREASEWFNLGRLEEYKHMSQPIEVRAKEKAPIWGTV